MLLAGNAVLTRMSTSIQTSSARATIVSAAVSGEEPRASGLAPEDPREPRFDLNGNEVEDAVADYRVDLRGGIYERHSPDTAVSKLGPPGT
jgi:hypothetical protein